MKLFIKLLIFFWIFFIVLVTGMGLARHVYSGGQRLAGFSKNTVIFFSEFLSRTVNFSYLSKPQIIEPKVDVVKSSFFKNRKNEYVLISYFDKTLNQPVVKIQGINDSIGLHYWKPDISQMCTLYNNFEFYGAKNILKRETSRIFHPLLFQNGNIVFGNGLLFKINKNSDIVWSSDLLSHHSIEFDKDSNIWFCSYNPKPENAVKYKIMDDVIAEVSPVDCKVLYIKSVFEILMQNGFSRSDFFINANIINLPDYLDYIHLNDVQPVLSDSKYWKKGDLFLSLRNQNLVLLYRPAANKIIWWKRGPWLKQHDVQVIDSTRIAVFGNNVLDANFENPDDRWIDGHNVEYVYDFSTNEITTPYNEFFESAKIKTNTEGRARILPDGNIFVEETNHCRLLLGNQKEEIWSYVEKAGKNKLSMLSWCRYITEDEFKQLTFLKNQHN